MLQFNTKTDVKKENWYSDSPTVVHALGMIDNATYTNSREALENSYLNGARLLECDFNMTSDNQIVACHDWDFWYSWEHESENREEYVPDFDEFMRTPVLKYYTPLSGEDIILFMKDNPDVYIITDTKDEDPDTLAEPFKALVALAEKNDCKDVLERFVVQIYHEYMYELVEEVYAFPHYIFTLYREDFTGTKDKMEAYARFCENRNIDVITMWSHLYHNGLSKIANRYGIKIFVHTVNDNEEIKDFLDKGVGVYTDLTNLPY